MNALLSRVTRSLWPKVTDDLHLEHLSLDSLKRAFSGQGRYKRDLSAFNALADYDKSRSAGVAWGFGAATLGASGIGYHYFHTARKRDKEEEFARLALGILACADDASDFSVGKFHFACSENGITISEGSSSFTLEKSLTELKSDLRKDLLEAIKTSKSARTAVFETLKTSGEARTVLFKAIETSKDVRIAVVEAAKTSEDVRTAFLEAAKVSDDKHIHAINKKITLNFIHSELTNEAKVVFRSLLRLRGVGSVSETSPVVTGDPDGSISRLLLVAVHTGHVVIDLEGQKLLAVAMNQEARALLRLSRGTGNEEQNEILQQVQTNELNRKTIRDLTLHLTYRAGHALCVEIGDLFHDRLISDKNVLRAIALELKKVGVIFITGNHDVLFKKGTGAQSGKFALDDLDEMGWKDFQDKVLTNAYYDEKTNTVFVHHGIALLDNEKTVETAFGNYAIPDTGFKAEDFVAWVNHQGRPLPDCCVIQEEKKEANLAYHKKFIKYRPKKEKIRTAAAKLDVRIVHGHNDDTDYDSSPHVVSLNPRQSAQSQCFPVAARIGGYALKTPVTI